MEDPHAEICDSVIVDPSLCILDSLVRASGTGHVGDLYVGL